jgi:hypothetical protein
LLAPKLHPRASSAARCLALSLLLFEKQSKWVLGSQQATIRQDNNKEKKKTEGLTSTKRSAYIEAFTGENHFIFLLLLVVSRPACF